MPIPLQLSSLLDLSTRLAESDSEDRILNAAVLSVMGKLKILRACVLQPDDDAYVITHAKGVANGRVSVTPSRSLRYTSDADDTAPLRRLGMHWIVPLMVRDQVLALLCFGPTLEGIDDAEDVRTYMELVQSITATAIHNAQMVQSLIATTHELQRRNLLVTTLFESARDFSDMKDVAAIMRTLSYRLMGQLMISTFAVYLNESLHGQTVFVNRSDQPQFAALEFDVHQVAIPQRVDPLHGSDVHRRLDEAHLSAVAPLTVHGERKGTIAVGPKLNGMAFTDEELSFIEALGNTAMAAIESDRAIERERERQRMENELAIAATIQRGLLPLTMPTIEGYAIAASTISSKQVSGDYYDVIQLDANRTMVAIADVSGKGVPASLVMANVQAALNVLASLDLPLSSLAERINALVCDNTDPDVFVTMFVGLLDASAHTFDYVNMGHNPPMMVRGEETTLLTDGGVLAGVIPNPPPYKTGRLPLLPGDVVLLYTDGVTEAQNDDGGEYGVEALQRLVIASAAQTAQEIVETLLRDVRAHSQRRLPDDDTSILVLKHRDPSL